MLCIQPKYFIYTASDMVILDQKAVKMMELCILFSFIH